MNTALFTSLLFGVVALPCTQSTVNYQHQLIVAQWDTGGIDYLWDSTHVKDEYVASNQFQINNNAIAGVKIAPTKAVFVTVPRWFPGVPSTLNTVVLSSLDTTDTRDTDTNPTLVPWPSWAANAVGGDCTGLQYVQSMEIDAAGLMWVIDVGRINIFDATGSLNRCPPKLLVIDTKDGSFVDAPYVFPDEIASHRTNFLNDIVLDNKRQIAYISDTSGSGGIVVYDRVRRRSQRFENPATMRADTTGDITWNIGGHSYPSNWTAANTPLDGIALSACGCTLYYTPLASIHLFSISAAHLRDFGQGGASKDSSFALANTTIQRLGLKEAPSDGMTFDCAGTLIYGGT
jgi:sugar lactone lactonase YvrE